jgi:hypothetical protein
MKTGNINGSSKCEKCELAWAKPTKPMTATSSRQGVSVWVSVVINERQKGAKDEDAESYLLRL